MDVRCGRGVPQETDDLTSKGDGHTRGAAKAITGCVGSLVGATSDLRVCDRRLLFRVLVVDGQWHTPCNVTLTSRIKAWPWGVTANQLTGFCE